MDGSDLNTVTVHQGVLRDAIAVHKRSVLRFEILDEVSTLEHFDDCVPAGNVCGRHLDLVVLGASEIVEHPKTVLLWLAAVSLFDERRQRKDKSLLPASNRLMRQGRHRDASWRFRF